MPLLAWWFAGSFVFYDAFKCSRVFGESRSEDPLEIMTLRLKYTEKNW